MMNECMRARSLARSVGRQAIEADDTDSGARLSDDDDGSVVGGNQIRGFDDSDL